MFLLFFLLFFPSLFLFLSFRVGVWLFPSCHFAFLHMDERVAALEALFDEWRSILKLCLTGCALLEKRGAALVNGNNAFWK